MLVFLLSPIGRWIAGLAVAGILIGSTDAYIAIHEYNKGWHAAIAAIAKKDQGAINESIKAKSEVDFCYSSGRTWSVVDGVCE